MKFYNVGVDELCEYELSELESDNFKFIVYWYEGGSWDGQGRAIGYNMEDGLLYIKDLGHCSCYGPTDGGMLDGDKMTVEEFLSGKEDIHSYDERISVKEKVKELLRNQ